MEDLEKEYIAYLQGDLKPATIFKKAKVLQSYLSWCSEHSVEILTASYAEVLNYIDECRNRNYVVQSLNEIIGVLRQFYELLQEKEVREDNPALEIRMRGGIKKQQIALLTEAETEAIFTSFPSTGLINKRSKAIVGLLVYQGISTAEIIRLQVSDVNLKEGVIYIPAALRGNARTLTLNAKQAIHLQTYLLSVRKAMLVAHKQQTDKLFFRTGSKGSMDGTFNSIIKQIQQSQPQVQRIHQIRVSVLSHWLKKYHIRQVQYMAGHRWISSTASYRTHELESLQEILEKVHPMQ